MSLSQAIFNMAVGCVLFPALLLIILDSRQNRANGESDLHADLKANATAVSNTLQRWQHRRAEHRDATGPAGHSRTFEPRHLQRDLELLARASPDFIGLCIAALPVSGGCAVTRARGLPNATPVAGPTTATSPRPPFATAQVNGMA